MNLYKQQKDNQQARMSAFLNQNAFFAFSKEQFQKGIERLGIEPNAEKVLIPIPGGGYVRKEKAADFRALLDQAENERKAALDDPETGRQFARDMFLYELANHEYTYTGDTEETLAALGYFWKDIEESEVLQNGLLEARRILNESE